MFDFLPEQPGDGLEIETLLDQAFGPGRTAKQSYAYRRNVAPIDTLALTARHDGRLVGTIRYWPVAIGRSRMPALLLGPVAVAPDLRGRGVGRTLIERTLADARNDGHRLVLLVGDPDYYARYGFGPSVPHGIVMPGEQPHRLRVRELAEGALAAAGGPVWPHLPATRPALVADLPFDADAGNRPRAAIG